MPKERAAARPRRRRSIAEKMRAPHFQRRLLQAAGDLSAPGQRRFLETVERLAAQLRRALLETGGILRIEKDHAALWKKAAGRPVGFVDGGLTGPPMLGSAPVAVRAAGYAVTPGARGSQRERFSAIKHLIDKLYVCREGEIFEDIFPDVGALRDAARIAVSAAGAVRLLAEQPNLAYVFLRGALVHPVLRFSGTMRDGQTERPFPDFSDAALKDFLPPRESAPAGDGRRFLDVHLRQLQFLEQAQAVVCGVVERESAAVSVRRALLDALDDDRLHAAAPSGGDFDGRRITDALLFQCVLEPGEALLPVPVERNAWRSAPGKWRDEARRYPQPQVSYLQVGAWDAPTRLEIFAKDRGRFREAAELAMHCALLLPCRAFPLEADADGREARAAGGESRPAAAHAALQAMRQALQQNDVRLFDALRLMLCASESEFLFHQGGAR